MKLFETYNISIKKIRKKDGTFCNYAYIDPKKSTDSTIDIKDDIKNYGATWNSFDRVWGWYLSGDAEKLKAQLQNRVYPAIEFLNSRETPPEEGPRSAEDMKAEFNQVLKMIDDAISTPFEVPQASTPLMDEKTLKQRLQEFKEELVSAMSNEAFLAKLEPIIKFRNANGHELSFNNALLIWLQDKDAKLVKARGTWAKIYHRTVKDGAPALFVSVPQKSKHTIYATKEERAAFTKEFLKQLGKSSVDELTAGEKDILRVKLLGLNRDAFTSFKYAATYYDVRYTEQMEGYDDEVGSFDGVDDIEWTDTTSEPTELTTKIYDATLEVIREAGIAVNFVDDLGGAMGVSKSGTIDVLKDNNKNAGAASTLIHEFSHELLHQRYLQGRGQDWANYFVGTAQGRKVVEQQAELSAYLVLRFFGIKMTQNINYIAIWGADAAKASKVFDTIANVANFIANKIAVKMGMKSLNEDEMAETGTANFTGLDVAELLGSRAVLAYNKSKRKEMASIKENFYRVFDKINTQLF